MKEVNDSHNKEEWDQILFGLIDELLIKNQSVYEQLAIQLLDKKKLEISVNGFEIVFKLTPIGCSYSFRPNENKGGGNGWRRMGWSKKSKFLALPDYFAHAEAMTLINHQV